MSTVTSLMSQSHYYCLQLLLYSWCWPFYLFIFWQSIWMSLNRNAYAKFRLRIFSRHKIVVHLTNTQLFVWWIVDVFSSNYVTYCLEWGGVTPHDPSPRETRFNFKSVPLCLITQWQRKLWVFTCKFQNRALTVATVSFKIQKKLIVYLFKTGLAHMGSMNCLLYRDIPCLCCYNPQFLPEILLVGFRHVSCSLFGCIFCQFH